MLCVSVLTYLKQFVKTGTSDKNLSIALNKKHASKELLRFWILKNAFIKKDIEHLEADERVKNAIKRFKYEKLCCGPLMLAAL